MSVFKFLTVFNLHNPNILRTFASEIKNEYDYGKRKD